MNTFRNFVLSLCVGSLAAIIVNMRINQDYKFSSTALAIGFFVCSATFVFKPIKEKQKVVTS